MKTMYYALSLILLASCHMETDNDSRHESEAPEIAEYIATEEFAKMNYPFSQAVIYDDIIYLSGQVGNMPGTDVLVEGGIGPETRQTMLNIQEVLEENGSSIDKIIKCTCMLADISEWAKMSEEYVKFFPDHKPARSAFAGTGLALGARVEIECMAVAGER